MLQQLEVGSGGVGVGMGIGGGSGTMNMNTNTNTNQNQNINGNQNQNQSPNSNPNQNTTEPINGTFNDFGFFPREADCEYKCPEIDACISENLWCDGKLKVYLQYIMHLVAFDSVFNALCISLRNTL